MTIRNSRRSRLEYAGAPRCAIYIRVSDPKQERDGTSLISQEESCRAHAQARGYGVVAVHRDVHTGADLFERTALSALRDSIRAQDIDIVLAHALDRLSRNQDHLGLLFSECDHRGIRVELVTEQLEDTPEGRLLQAVRGFVAEVERLKIKERTQRGIQKRVESGKLLAGGRPLYGYQWRDHAKSALDLNPATAPVVRRIFRDALAGTSLRKIAQALTAEYVSSPGGLESWRASTVHGILTRQAYTGLATAYHSSQEPGRTPMVLPPGTIPPLVDLVDFATVQCRLSLNKERSQRNNQQPDQTLLRGGIARCGYCGNAASTRQDRNRPSRSYFCSNTNRDRYGCPPFTVQAHLLDGAVWQIVEQILTNEELIKAKLEALSLDRPMDRRLDEIEQGVRSIHERQQRLARIIATVDDDTAAPLIDELRELATQARRLEDQRAKVQASRLTHELHQRQVIDVLEWRHRVAINLPRLTYDERRQVLDALGASVHLRAARDEPRWELTLQPNYAIGADTIVYSTAGGSSGTRARRCSACWG